MCPQFVDFDGDGYTDIITATYEGVPSLVRGSAAGFEQPQHLTDEAGNAIMMNIYWDHEQSRWSERGGGPMNTYTPSKHCVSATAFDYDGDGDYDLLLGAYEDRVLLRRNNGTPGAHAFASENEEIEAGGKPFALKGGITAARPIDWDGDGDLDLVAGGFKGGVYLFENSGSAQSPAFEAAAALIEPKTIDDPANAFPTSGCYVDAVDYDGDGDLDLLVGGYAEWTTQPRELTDEQQARYEELRELSSEKQQAMIDVMEALEDELAETATAQERSAVYQDEAYQTAYTEWREVSSELQRLQPNTRKREAGVWLYRRK